MKEFTRQCIDFGSRNASACALLRPNLTADALYEQLYELTQEAKRQPIIMGPNVTTDIVTYEKIKRATDTALRFGIQFAPNLAGYLNSILIRDTPEYNHTHYLAYRFDILPDDFPSVDNTQLTRCSDAMYRADELADIEDRVQEITESGYWNGDQFTSSYMMCALWKVQAKERYEGDFRAKTKNPVLLIGSLYDVRTPISGAYAANKTLEGSVVLQHNGLGHSIMYSPGICAIAVSAEYFANETMPEEGTVCEQDFGIFSGKKLKDTLNLLEGSL